MRSISRRRNGRPNGAESRANRNLVVHPSLPGSQPPPANVQPEQVERRAQAGMDEHVGKPIQVAELLRLIPARLEQRTADRDGAAAA
jgi:hypothetical protein